MAVKFFFKPVTQNVGLSIAKMALKQYMGLGGVKSDAIAFAKQYFKGNLTLPVNPQTLEITTQSDNKKVNVVKSGQIVIPKGVNLSTLTIESFFPSTNILLNRLTGGYVPSYIITSLGSMFNSFTSQKYYEYFETLQQTQIPVRLVISDCGIDMDVLVESIKKRYESQDEDIHYTLNLIEYRKTSTRKLQPKVSNVVTTVKAVIATKPPRAKSGLAIGDKVLVDGPYCHDSFGSKPTNTFKNFTGKISHIASNPNATHKYHITTLDGGWRGWVKSEHIKGVE